MKLKSLIKSKKGLVIEYALFAGLVLFSFSVLIFSSWARSQARDHYFNSHISKPLEFEIAGQQFFRTCQVYNDLTPEQKEQSNIIEEFNYPITNYKYESNVTKNDDVYTYKINVCMDEEENTWLLTLEVKVNIVTEKIVKWYFVNPLYESDLYINGVKEGEE